MGEYPSTSDTGAAGAAADSGDDGGEDDGGGDGGGEDSGSEDSGSEDGGAHGRQHVATLAFSTDSDGSAIDEVCFDVEHLGHVYEVALEHSEVEYMDVVLYPAYLGDCEQVRPAISDECARALFWQSSDDPGWDKSDPPAVVQINRISSWCLWGSYAETRTGPLAHVEIPITITDLGPDDVGTGLCGPIHGESACVCEDPKPSTCPS